MLVNRRAKIALQPSKTETGKPAMFHIVDIRADKDNTQRRLSNVWDLEPSNISYGDVNSIRWIQARCADFFNEFDEGRAVVFTYGPFANAINNLTLDITLELFIPSYSRVKLDEIWSQSGLYRGLYSTLEVHLRNYYVEREVTIRCADDPPYPLVNQTEGIKPESSQTETDQGETIQLYPNCPVLVDSPWKNPLFA